MLDIARAGKTSQGKALVVNLQGIHTYEKFRKCNEKLGNESDERTWDGNDEERIEKNKKKPVVEWDDKDELFLLDELENSLEPYTNGNATFNLNDVIIR